MSDDDLDVAAVRVIPPLVPLGVLVAGVLLARIWPVAPGLGVGRTLRWTLGGMAISGVWCLGLWALVSFRRTDQDPEPWKPTPELVTSGPYRITRNPMCLMMVGTCLGLGLVLGNLWILALTPVCAWVLRRFAIVPEEEYLEAKFGEPFREYRRTVRRWL